MVYSAHPKAKVFMTHGGSHGIYEGICNAVPMVMVPLFGDQGMNVDRMVSRGVAKSISVVHVTTEELLDAINTVITDQGYDTMQGNPEGSFNPHLKGIVTLP